MNSNSTIFNQYPLYGFKRINLDKITKILKLSENDAHLDYTGKRIPEVMMQMINIWQTLYPSLEGNGKVTNL
jgi:hypothetical protein